MSSQYEKRKVKEAEALAKEIMAKREKAKEEVVVAPVMTHKALDIFTSDNGKVYNVVEIEYNPTTGEARVGKTTNISRMVALQFENQKVALMTLKRTKRGN